MQGLLAIDSRQPRRCRGWLFFRLAREWVARLKEVVQKHGVSTSIEMLDAFRYGKINQPLTHSATEKSTSVMGCLIFPRLAREWVARLNEIERKHGFSAAIEMLDAFRYGKINKPQARAVAV